MVVLAWVVTAALATLGIADAVVAPAPTPEQPDFIDTILASRAVVAAIRLAIVFAAGFVVLSVVALIARRQWLTRVGPVEVSEMSDLDAENHRLEEELETAHREIDALRNEVAYAHQLVDREDL